MHRFANPARFLRLAALVLPWVSVLSVLLFAAGLYLALFASPGDYQQGDTVRIMYVHVPAAWMAMFTYSSMAVAAACALVWRHPLAEIYSKAAAPLGAGFTLLCLVTGSLWGEPMWGTWWVWDARLTSELILLFLYLGYIALQSAIEDRRAAARAGAVLAIVGVVNIPIIHYSVEWWSTLHQGATVTKFDKPSIATSMLIPLLTMTLGFKALFAAILLVRTRCEILEFEQHTHWVRELAAAEPLR